MFNYTNHGIADKYSVTIVWPALIFESIWFLQIKLLINSACLYTYKMIVSIIMENHLCTFMYLKRFQLSLIHFYHSLWHQLKGLKNDNCNFTWSFFSQLVLPVDGKYMYTLHFMTCSTLKHYMYDFRSHKT